MPRKLPDDHPLRPVLETRVSTGKPGRRATGRPGPGKGSAGAGRPAAKRKTHTQPRLIPLPGAELTSQEARVARVTRALALVASPVAVYALAHRPTPVVFMASLALPPFLAGLAAFCARRPHGIEQASGHVLRVALPLAALLWAVSGMNGALAFPTGGRGIEWWALGLGGVMLLAGWSAYQAEPQPRTPGGVYGLLGALLAAALAYAAWKGAAPAGSTWLRLSVASGAAAMLAVCLRPFVAPASLAAGLVALAFILLDLRKWL